MRNHQDEHEHDEHAEPKDPRLVAPAKKGTNSLEGSEGLPWRHLKDAERDRHRQL